MDAMHARDSDYPSSGLVHSQRHTVFEADSYGSMFRLKKSNPNSQVSMLPRCLTFWHLVPLGKLFCAQFIQMTQPKYTSNSNASHHALSHVYLQFCALQWAAVMVIIVVVALVARPKGRRGLLVNAIFTPRVGGLITLYTHRGCSEYIAAVMHRSIRKRQGRDGTRTSPRQLHLSIFSITKKLSSWVSVH